MKIAFAISFLSLLTGMICFIFHAFGHGKKYFRIATISTLVSLVALTVLIIMQGAVHGFKPVDFLSQPAYIIAWVMLITYFLAEYKFRIRVMGSLFIPIIAIIMLLPGLGNSPEPVTRNTLNSPFFINLHVVLLIASFAFWRGH